jgi:hypothetical protein
MNAGHRRDLLEEVTVHVETLHFGLQGLMQMLAGEPADRPVGAAHIRTLLAPLADEARQAEPVTRMLLGGGPRSGC